MMEIPVTEVRKGDRVLLDGWYNLVIEVRPTDWKAERVTWQVATPVDTVRQVQLGFEEMVAVL